MKRTSRTSIASTATWVVPVFTIALLVLIQPDPAAGQRSRPNRAAENPKIKVGEFPPDFELPRLTFQTDAEGKTVGVINDKDTVRLSSFRGKRPVCMIMSSYT